MTSDSESIIVFPFVGFIIALAIPAKAIARVRGYALNLESDNMFNESVDNFLWIRIVEGFEKVSAEDTKDVLRAVHASAKSVSYILVVG